MDEKNQIDVNLASIWGRIDDIVDGFIQITPVLLIAIILFILFIIASAFCKKLIIRTTKNKQNASLGLVLGRITQWVIVLVGLLLSLVIVMPSVTPGKLIGALGIGGVAIGFAFKDILQNFMAGILILIREPFKLGDEIIYQDFKGRVTQIETRSTFIKTYDGRQVIIPNGQIYTNPVIVESAYDSRRTSFDVGIGYEDDINAAVREILKAIDEVDLVLSDPKPDVLVTGLGDNAVILKARWWTKSVRGHEKKASSAVVQKIKERLDAADIDMPYPTNVLLFHNLDKQ